MEPLTADTAMQALQAAWDEDHAQEQSPVPQEAAPSEGQESNQVPAEEKPAGLFYDVDPNTLTPEMRRVFDGMQAAFTQKSQEFSARSKEWDSLGDPTQVKQAVEWVNSLNDPNNLVQLHSELSDYLQQSGYTKAEADQAAASAIQEQPDTEEYGFADPEIAQLRSTVQELSQWKSEFQNQLEQARAEAQLEREELRLRQDRGYDDTAIGRIYQLSYSHGGSLSSAADAYDQMKNDFISAYVNEKAEAPQPATAPIRSSTFGQIPESFGDDFDAAHRFAKDKLMSMQRAGAFEGE